MGKITSSKITTDQNGFTLVEVLITLFISMFIFMALYTVYDSQNKTYVTQQSVLELQQNIRAATNILVKDLRMAGFDPSGSGNFGFVDNTSPVWPGGVTVNSTANQIAFTVDLDADGSVNLGAVADVNGDGSTDMSDTETISYRLNGTDLQKYGNTNGAIHWQTVAENVQDLSFQYLDKDDNPTTDLDKIRSVNFSLLVFTEELGDMRVAQSFTNAAGNVINIDANDLRNHRFVSYNVYCRNMGL